jgi:hypothetical protein
MLRESQTGRSVLLALLLAAAPVVWFLGGCLQGTTAGAGMARVVTHEEAVESPDATLSVRDDKFAGVKVTRLRNNRLPNPSGSVLNGVIFDGVCVDHDCALAVELTGVDALTGDYPRLQLVVDGIALGEMRAKTARTLSGFAVESSVVVILDTEAMRAVIAAKEIEYRIERKREKGEAAALDGDEGVYEGQLSPENVLNVREWLTLSGVDPWAAQEPEEEPARPHTAPVGAPPNEAGSRTAPQLGSPR